MTISHLRRTVVALAATATLGLAGCGGEDTDPETTPAPTEQASESPSASEEEPRPDEETSPPAPVDEVVIDVAIAGDDITPTAQQVELGVGETLLLEVNSDRPGELHVHSSPEQFADFQAGATRLDFTFDKPGSVDIEEHESGALIARVLVQ